MDWLKITRKSGTGNWIKIILPAIVALILIKLFVPEATTKRVQKDQPFSMKTCLESIPRDVKGLEIIQGSRSKTSIIHEMVPIVCNAKALFKKLTAEGTAIESGSMTLRVIVEYTGEVISVRIQDSGITYRPFRNKIIDMIADSDFTPWQKEDTDTEFLYPIHFKSR